ncbi:organic cation transporter protein-like [Leptidea sinapis]|uniref:organic cation transporter protein-like n=1 Tax=Leptidea sinapis TaxID=189913 RepID=UPI0021C27321|nr:organic cation transporter protein-like [Leptidea sinapis]
MFGVGFHSMSIIFLAPPVSFKCPNNATCCDHPVYNKTIFSRTIVTEWNLICGYSWMKEFTQIMFQLGALIGSLIFGIASDRFGRRPTMIFVVVLQLFAGITSSFLPGYWSFAISRLVLGSSVGGIIVVGYVIVLEFAGSEYRITTSALFHIPFGLGILILAVLGYFLTDYLHLQLAISLPCALLLFYVCLLPESPRWLLAVNKTMEAISLMERIAKINNQPTEGIERQVQIYRMEHLRVSDRRESAMDIIRCSYMRLNIFISSFIWFTCSCCFYGAEYYVRQISEDIHIIVVASGTACVCGCLIAIPLIKLMNRVSLILICNVISSACLLINCVIPEGVEYIVIGCIEILLSFTVFVVIYLYCAELFPTTVRSSALGISSTMISIGAIIAPYIVSLKTYGSWCVPIIFAILSLISAALCLMLPETKGRELTTTVEEEKNKYRK